MHRATFPCPLCRDVGRVVTLEAELEPPSMIVTDLQGGCEHPAAFDKLEGPTIEEVWTRIEGALDAASGEEDSWKKGRGGEWPI